MPSLSIAATFSSAVALAGQFLEHQRRGGVVHPETMKRTATVTEPFVMAVARHEVAQPQQRGAMDRFREWHPGQDGK